MIYILLGIIIGLLLVILRVLYVIQLDNKFERRIISSNIKGVRKRIYLLEYIVKNKAKNSCNTIKWKYKSVKKPNAKLKLNIAKNNDVLTHPKE